MNSKRYFHAATLLPEGNVLVAGGFGVTGSLSSVEIYEPDTETWMPANPMAIARSNLSATLLASGKVLVAGGQNGNSPLSSAEIYDPVTGAWTPTGSMNSARSRHTATMLANGKVLVAGGYDSISKSSAEVYDPSTGTWATVGAMSGPRFRHTATLLANGKVLVAGGANLSAAPVTSSDLFNPTTGIWTTTGSMNVARSYYAATLLSNGRVLVAGSYADSTAELYNPSTGIWTATGSMNASRSDHTLTPLPGGKALVAGGYSGTAYIPDAELYNSSTGVWTNTGSMSAGRHGHMAVVLPNGEVLVSGGYNSSGALAGVELYDPGPPPPAITVHPMSVTINSGNSVTLDVEVSGTSPTFQWYMGNSGDVSNPVNGEISASYTTPALTSTTSFWVMATNGAGSANSNTATITVRPPAIAPVITRHPASVTVNSGNTARLAVEVSGTSPTFKWYIGNSGDISNPVIGEIYASYTTPALTSTTSFWVKATNGAGSANSNTATITVKPPVIAPVITRHPVSVTVNSGDGVTLAVEASGTSPKFQWYRGDSGDISEPVSGANSASYTTPGLTSTTSFWARASNSAGIANSNAATVKVRIAPAIIKQPVSITIEKDSRTTLGVRATGTSLTYQWYKGKRGDITKPIPKATSRTYKTPPLKVDTKYWVRVKNQAGVASSMTVSVKVR